jgi:outer membrane murein-binding lipoprotein Lpp
MMAQIVTPQQIEARLYALSKEIDAAHEELNKTESEYHLKKAEYEVSMARSRMTYASKSSPTGKNYTIQERDDLALLDNENLHFDVNIIEAKVKAARNNAARIRVQVDLTRSMSASVRTSMDL